MNKNQLRISKKPEIRFRSDSKKAESSGANLISESDSQKLTNASPATDPRYRQLVDLCEQSWRRIHLAHGISPAPPFGFTSRDRTAAKDFLKSLPKSPVEIFEGWFVNREVSDGINPSAMPHKYLANLCSFASGALDRFGKPIRQNNQSPAKQRVDAGRRVLAKIAIERGLIDLDRFGGGAGQPLSSAEPDATPEPQPKPEPKVLYRGRLLTEAEREEFLERDRAKTERNPRGGDFKSIAAIAGGSR